MHERKEDLPDAISVEGVSLKGTEFGPMSAAHGQMAKGTDLAPVLEGLPGDKCQVPHWGYVIEGAIEVLYQDGSRETVRSGTPCGFSRTRPTSSLVRPARCATSWAT